MPVRGSKPGERRGGRKKGTPNKTTKLLKEAILAAAERAGNQHRSRGGLVAYLEKQAMDNPAAFMTLLGKVLPMQVSGEGGGPVKVTLADFYANTESET